MKNNFLDEIQQIREREVLMEIKLPMPNYLFVQNYGRSLEANMPEISALLQMQEWFYFNTDRLGREESIISRFLLEQKCNAKPGREYAGCVLVEVSGEEDEREFAEFLTYINTQRQRLRCIFTTREMGQVEILRRRLANGGFVRVICGECFEVCEQVELFISILGNYGFLLEDNAGCELKKLLQEKKWQKEDLVEKQIHNLVNELVYEKLLEGNVQNNVVTGEDIARTLRKMKEEALGRRQIGFV